MVRRLIWKIFSKSIAVGYYPLISNIFGRKLVFEKFKIFENCKIEIKILVFGFFFQNSKWILEFWIFEKFFYFRFNKIVSIFICVSRPVMSRH